MNKLFTYQENIDCFEEVLPNGIKLFLVPHTKGKSVAVSYVFKIGGTDYGFIDQDGKKVELPTGIAHFLEHQLFKQEDGTDGLKLLEAQGANPNAYTSYYHTNYHFITNTNFIESLKIMLNYVTQPHFVEESVALERTIISEEYYMYKDNYNYLGTMKSMTNTFHQHPAKIDIIGTIDDITGTTADDLYKTYNHYYRHDNSAISIVGNFDLEATIEFIKAYFSNLELPEINIKPIPYQEPAEVVKEYEEYEADVKVPLITSNYKIRNPQPGKYEVDLAFDILLNNLFGKASLFNEENMETNFINGFDFRSKIFNDYIILLFKGQTDNPERALKKINHYLINQKISEAEFERQKKVLIRQVSESLDYKEYLTYQMAYDFERYNTVLNQEQLIKTFTYKEFLDIIRNVSFEHYTNFVITPKKTK